MALQAPLAVQLNDQQPEDTEAWRTATRLRTQRQEQPAQGQAQAPSQQEAAPSLPSKSQTLSSHIRQAALLSSQCHDVSVAAFDRVYRLHRIFLVQSSFFSSMLRGGFSEGLNYRPPDMSYSSGSNASDSGSTLRLTFDDPNITRPAFEYCIAHLYGAAPELILPQWAIASTAQPLSSYWPPASGSQSRPQPVAAASVTGDFQPATPRFLVSLLCASLWLGIPSLTASSFTLILASFTPYTVSTYLRFALGRPLIGAQEARDRGESSEAIWDWELEGPCWGMDHIGTLEQGRGASYESTSAAAPLQRTNTGRTAPSSYHSDYEDAPSEEGEQDDKPTRSSSIRLGETRRGGRPRSRSSLHHQELNDEDDQRSASGSRVFNHKHQPSAIAAPNVAGSAAGAFGSSSYDTFARAAPAPEVSLDYGPFGRRVAESCFCYFARWGREIAAAEEVKWGKDEAALHALLDSMDRGQDSAHGQAVVCEAVAPYLLPRGYLPATLPEQASTMGAVRPGDKKVKIEASVQWDLPCPALNVFSHPTLSHTLFEIRSLGLSFTPGLIEELMYFVDPMSDSSLGLASSHLVDFLSSDAFFVRNELQRYDVAKNIVTFRRDQKALVEELQEALGLLDEGFGYAYTDDSQSAAPADASAFVKVEPTDSQPFGSSPATHDDSVAGRVRARSRAESSASARPWTTPPRLHSSATLSNAAPTPSPRNHPFSRLNIHRHADDTSMDLDDSLPGNGASKGWPTSGRDGDDFQMLEEDDVHYARLFEQGIYYSHLDFDDLKRLSEEAAMLADSRRDAEDGDTDSDNESRRAGGRGSGVSPRRQATAQMFAPVEVLQAALWAGHDLRARVMGAAQSSQEEGGVESIRRGLAFMGDSSAEGLPASTSGILEAGARLRSQEALVTSAAERDESLLGISSSLKQFAQAFQQTITGHSRRGTATRFGRTARGETPATPLGSPSRTAASRSTPEGTSLTLGGLSYSPLTPGGGRASGAHPAAKALLNKRYFSVPVDDTVRYGEYFTGLLGASSSSNALASGAAASVSTDPIYASDATGLAAMRDPLSLPPTVPPHARTAVKKILPVIADSPLLSNVDRYLTGGPLSDMKRITGNLFGLKNKASTGKALGKVGVEVSRKKALLDGEPHGDVTASPSSYFSSGKSRTAQATGSRSNPIDLSHTSGTLDGSARETLTNISRDDEESGTGTGQRGNPAPAAHSEEDRDLDSGLQLARLETRSWTGFEPMRIGVEYYGLDLLEEKHRLYSPSFFYAGSVWNLYVQTIRKPKGTQLGVYLHRQSPMEPLPPATASPESVANFYHGAANGAGGANATPPGPAREAGAAVMDEQIQQGGANGNNGAARGRPPQQQQGQGQGPAQVPHLPARLDSLPINGNLSLPLNAVANANANPNANNNRDAGGTPPPPRYGATFTQPELPFAASSPSAPNSGPPVLPGTSPAVPYRDPRRLVRAFFSIHCHAPLGSALTRFDSGPDRFLESQSWGWKSSSLMGVWELQEGGLSGGRAETADGFRCVVTMGVI